MLMPGLSMAQALKVVGNERDVEVFHEQLKNIKQTTDSAAYLTLSKLVNSVQEEGYFAAHILSDTLVNDTLFASVALGKQFEWAYLQPGNLDILAQEKSGFREKFFINKPFRYNEVTVLFNSLLKHAENTGYPFASVSLANISMAGHKIYADIHYQPGPKITFGRLQVTGNAKVKSSFLEAYFNMLPGSSYDERKIKQIPAMLKELPFLSLNAPVEVTFQNETADVILNVSEMKSNRADGLINFLPAEGKERSLLLTGELNIQLNNLWQSGKEFMLRWRRLQVASQQLELNYLHSRIFRLPLDAGVYFNMLKEDTLFYNRKLSFQLGLPFGTKHITTTINWQSSRLLKGSFPTDETLTADMADFDFSGVSIAFNHQNTDHKYYPKRGYRLLLEGEIGKKKILPGISAALDRSRQALAEPVSVSQQALRISAEYYQKLGKNWVLFHKLSGAGVFGRKIFVNDMYRIGGIHSLRGFYDNFFFASQYGLSNLELRLLFEQTKETYSHLFVFYDQAYMQRNTVVAHTKDYPIGLGAGISLSTSAGAFSLVYGVGKSALQPFNVQSAKVHFGYISRF